MISYDEYLQLGDESGVCTVCKKYLCVCVHTALGVVDKLMVAAGSGGGLGCVTKVLTTSALEIVERFDDRSEKLRAKRARQVEEANSESSDEMPGAPDPLMGPSTAVNAQALRGAVQFLSNDGTSAHLAPSAPAAPMEVESLTGDDSERINSFWSISATQPFDDESGLHYAENVGQAIYVPFLV